MPGPADTSSQQVGPRRRGRRRGGWPARLRPNSRASLTAGQSRRRRRQGHVHVPHMPVFHPLEELRIRPSPQAVTVGLPSLGVPGGGAAAPLSAVLVSRPFRGGGVGRTTRPGGPESGPHSGANFPCHLPDPSLLQDSGRMVRTPGFPGMTGTRGPGTPSWPSSLCSRGGALSLHQTLGAEHQLPG